MNENYQSSQETRRKHQFFIALGGAAVLVAGLAATYDSWKSVLPEPSVDCDATAECLSTEAQERLSQAESEALGDQSIIIGG